jgi:hypothetical protein
MEMTKEDIESKIETIEKAIHLHRTLAHIAIKNNRHAMAAVAYRARNRIAGELAQLDRELMEK